MARMTEEQIADTHKRLFARANQKSKSPGFGKDLDHDAYRALEDLLSENVELKARQTLE